MCVLWWAEGRSGAGWPADCTRGTDATFRSAALATADTYLPDEPLYTIHSGFEEPPNVDAAEYDGASASALG